MINRMDKKSFCSGLYDLTGKLIHGDMCSIFGEGTWNLHPFKPMQNIKSGSVKAAAIAGKPIAPVIMEYIEVPENCLKERELYNKCVVEIGKPIFIDPQKSMIEQNNKL